MKFVAVAILMLAPCGASARTWDYGLPLIYLIDKSDYLVSVTIMCGEVGEDSAITRYVARVDKKIYGKLISKKVMFSTWQSLEIGSGYLIFFQENKADSLHFMRALKIARGFLGGGEIGIQYSAESAVLIPSDLKPKQYIARQCQGPGIDVNCLDVVAFSYIPYDVFINYVDGRRSRIAQ